LKLVVYVDLLFLVNLVMNFMVLLLMKWLLKETTSYVRISFAAILGGLGACLVTVLDGIPAICSFLFLYVLISGGMVIIAFGFQNIKKFLIRICEIYCVAFLLGGFLSYVYYHMNAKKYVTELINGSVFSHFSAIYLIAGVGIVVMLYPIIDFMASRVQENITVLHNVKMYFEERHIIGTGLLDTGNMLRDPVTREPVLVAEYEWISNLFTEEQKKTLESYFTFSETENSVDNDIALKISMIPFNSVGNEGGLLPAVRIERVIISRKTRQKEKKSVLVGIYQGSLSSQKNYQVILHKDLT